MKSSNTPYTFFVCFYRYFELKDIATFHATFMNSALMYVGRFGVLFFSNKFSFFFLLYLIDSIIIGNLKT